MSRIWILGAADPEMEAIEALLSSRGETVAYALLDGRRVTPSQAYSAGVRSSVSYEEIRARGEEICCVECLVDDERLGLVDPSRTDCAAWVIVVDHHRPGDPGHGRPPVRYWEASSIGQVATRLGVAPTPELRLVAAADHCLAAAYRGECPGVLPDDVMRWRAASRAAYQRRPVEAVLADVAAATAALLAAPLVVLRESLCAWHAAGHRGTDDCLTEDGREYSDEPCSEVTVRDMCRDEPIPELPEAAARLGVGYISGPLIGPDGRRKYTCSGSSAAVAAWMERWAPEHGLVGLYGDPARGFAGGYLRDAGPNLSAKP